MNHLKQAYLKLIPALSENINAIFCNRLEQNQFIDLHQFKFTEQTSDFNIIEQILTKAQRIPLCNYTTTLNAKSIKLSSQLKQLVSKEKFIFNERGTKDLYLGWPFVQGKFNDGTVFKCPLLFFSINLEVIKGKWTCNIKAEVNITMNKSFLLAYSYCNDQEIPEPLLNETFTHFDINTDGFLSSLGKLLKDNELDYNIEKVTKFNTLQPFKPITKNELLKTARSNVLTLSSEAIIGIFPQSRPLVVHDYLSLLQNESGWDVKDYFNRKIKLNPNDETGGKISDRAKEENTFTPFEIDAYQEKALNFIKKGNSICIEGPPGSGKSQLIANLICDYIARGKKVLVVSQKKVALDIVYKRLASKEVNDFVGIVHDFKNDRKDIFDKLKYQIDRIDENKRKNKEVEISGIEKKNQLANEKIDKIIEELDDLKFALFDDSECGKSIKELYLKGNEGNPQLLLTSSFGQFKYADISKFEVSLKRYLSYHLKYESATYFWIWGASFALLDRNDLIEMNHIISESGIKFSELQKKCSHLLGTAPKYEELIFFLNKRNLLLKFIANIDHATTYQYFRKILTTIPDQNDHWLAQIERNILGCFDGQGIETTLKTEELGRFQKALQQALQRKRNLFKWINWRLFSKEKMWINRVLISNKLKKSRTDIKELSIKIDNRLNYEHNVSKLNEKKWLINYPKLINKITVQNWFFYQRNALNTYGQYEKLSGLGTLIDFTKNDRAIQIEVLNNFIRILDKLPEYLNHWKKYFSSKQLSELLSGIQSEKKIRKELTDEFDNLVDFHSIYDQFNQVEKEIAEQLKDVPGDLESRISDFQYALANYWIEKIEFKYPVLKSISSGQFESNLKILRESIDTKYESSKEITCYKSREKTYNDFTFDKSNRIDYNDLLSQLSRAPSIWPLRKVIAEYQEEVFKLIPCWITSAESASAIFPMTECFDLVIFDEASQCFAESGIPAIYRAKQLVIIGDEHQLAPVDIFKSKESPRHKQPKHDSDSIHNLAKIHLPIFYLNGHYRSKHPDLIQFSNSNFYNNALKIIPEFEAINSTDRPIKHHFVKGLWEKGLNLKEAQKAVAIVNQIIRHPAKKSIGILTFTSKQQALIETLIEEQIGDMDYEYLFIKNTQNSQGDERDIIILSTVFGPDSDNGLNVTYEYPKSKFNNLLNVAITRAKENLHIVSSLGSNQLNALVTNHPEVQVLKAYLQFARNPAIKSGKTNQKTTLTFDPQWYLKIKVKEIIEQINPDLEVLFSAPFADIIIKNNGEACGIILTDDEIYFNALSSKQTHIYEPALLVTRKWPNLAIHSREIWLSKTDLYQKIKRFIYRITSGVV